MSPDELDFSIVVPTCDRPDDLRACVRSVGEQTRPPREVIVVDDGDLPPTIVDALRETVPTRVDLEVTASDGPPGISVARNTGAREAAGSIVVFLDDDVVLGETYLMRLARLYELFDDERLAGVGGFDKLVPQSLSGRLYDRLFYQGPPGWRINRAGLSSTIPSGHRASPSAASAPWRADWLVGNNMSFRREVLLHHPFPQWNGGREVHEDLAQGWHLKREGYHCLVDPHLPLDHREVRGEANLAPYLNGGRNRVRLFRTYGDDEDWPLFAFAVYGEIQKEVFLGLVTGDRRRHWTRAVGLLAGTVTEALAPSSDPEYGPLDDQSEVDATNRDAAEEHDAGGKSDDGNRDAHRQRIVTSS